MIERLNHRNLFYISFSGHELHLIDDFIQSVSNQFTKREYTAPHELYNYGKINGGMSGLSTEFYSINGVNSYTAGPLVWITKNKFNSIVRFSITTKVDKDTYSYMFGMYSTDSDKNIIIAKTYKWSKIHGNCLHNAKDKDIIQILKSILTEYNMIMCHE